MEVAGQEVEKGVGGLEMMLECWNWCNKWDAKKKEKSDWGGGVAVFQTPQLYIFPLRAQNLSFILVLKPFVL
jgi:hypothetical protein